MIVIIEPKNIGGINFNFDKNTLLCKTKKKIDGLGTQDR